MPTIENEADLNTKVHPAPRFLYLIGLLGLRDRLSTRTGGVTAWKAQAQARALAAVTALQAIAGGRAEDGSTTCGADAPSARVGSTAWTLLLLVTACVGGWFLGRWSRVPSGVGSPAQTPAARPDPQQENGERRGIEAAAGTREVQTQSQVRYSWSSNWPRFVPLPKAACGAWVQ